MDNTSSMQLYVKLNREVNFSFQPRAKTAWIPLRMSTEIRRLGEGTIWNANYLLEHLSPDTTNTLSTRNSSMLMVSFSVYSPLVCRGPWMSTVVLYCWCHSDDASVLLYFTLLFESEDSFTNWSSQPKTKDLYLRFPSLWMKDFRMIVASLLLSFLWGFVV